MYICLSYHGLHALAHCPCYPKCYHVSKRTASIAEMIRDSTRKPESLVTLECQEFLECQVGRVDLADIATEEIMKSVLMKC